MARRLLLRDVHAVKRLLESGRSARAIARETGVSRGSVNAIRSGARGLFGRESDDADPDHPDSRSVLWSEADGYSANRCRGCGARAFMRPRDRGVCLACRVRAEATALSP